MAWNIIYKNVIVNYQAVDCHLVHQCTSMTSWVVMFVKMFTSDCHNIEKVSIAIMKDSNFSSARWLSTPQNRTDNCISHPKFLWRRYYHSQLTTSHFFLHPAVSKTGFWLCARLCLQIGHAVLPMCEPPSSYFCIWNASSKTGGSLAGYSFVKINQKFYV